MERRGIVLFFSREDTGCLRKFRVVEFLLSNFQQPVLLRNDDIKFSRCFFLFFSWFKFEFRANEKVLFFFN